MAKTYVRPEIEELGSLVRLTNGGSINWEVECSGVETMHITNSGPYPDNPFGGGTVNPSSVWLFADLHDCTMSRNGRVIYPR